MTPLDRINAYTAHRMGIMTKEERDARLADDSAFRQAWSVSTPMVNEYTTLTDDQKAAVDEMVRVCWNSGQRAERIFPDLEAEVYAYELRGCRIAWGMNSLETGVNFKRGITKLEGSGA